MAATLTLNMQTPAKTSFIKRKVLPVILIAALLFIVRYAWVSFPIMTGFTAKNVCSCVFVAGRNAKSVKAEELGDFPLSLARFEVHGQDSSVTSTMIGLAKRKAIYRPGLGCTLVNGVSEAELQKQTFKLPTVAADTSMQLARIASTELNQAALNDVVQKHINTTNAAGQHEARALLVLYDGELVAEHYAPGFDKNSRMLGWSMAKSVTGALVGILVKQGKLHVTQPAPVPEWSNANDPRHAITLQHLLQQTSGLDFEEDYSKYSNATRMLFQEKDMAAYTANRPLTMAPGKMFYYSSGNSNILSRIIRHTVGEEQYRSFIYDSLFKKIGMQSALLEADASGTMVGSSYLFATARDWARFGLMYYNNGNVNGEMLFTDDWVRQSVTTIAGDALQQYGYQFWLNGLDKEKSVQRKFPSAPVDMFYAGGYAGQNIFVIPSKKLVVVRLGFKKYDADKMLNEILQQVK
ncbi:MAG: class C beta-lactamase-related serine hydrolase [Chitinophagaceae bacterium]|nr:MAG: class C beta-lactamase-related serine hydrolase [Chitinophagaceae bacterium]